MTVAAYRDRTTGRYPIALDEIRAGADVLFGATPPQSVLDDANVDAVSAVSAPGYDASTHSLSEGEPELIDGEWQQTWKLAELPRAVIVVNPADLWRRTTEAEAEAIEGAMASQSAKLRNLFRTASTYRSDDPLWPVLWGAAVQLFQEPRAAELLAPST